MHKETVLIDKKVLERLIDEAEENCQERSVNLKNCTKEYDKIRDKYRIKKL